MAQEEVLAAGASIGACPLCRLGMRKIGRLVAGQDDANHHFVFAVCDRCTARLDRLPVKLQRRQMQVAISNLARQSEGRVLWFFDTEVEARIYCQMEAARLSQSR